MRDGSLSSPSTQDEDGCWNLGDRIAKLFIRTHSNAGISIHHGMSWLIVLENLRGPKPIMTAVLLG